MVPKEPGVYPGVSFADYHAAHGVNSSILVHFSRSAMHARHVMLAPDGPSPEQAFGTAAHALVLEPDRFPRDFAKSIKVDRRTNVGKAAWAEWQAENQGREPLEPEEWDTLHSLRDAVLANETARGLLVGPGANEVCLLWIDEETGTACKARLDRLTEFAGYAFAVDFKTARDASSGVFARDAFKYHYHEAAAFYADGLATLGQGAEARFAHVVAESEAPFGVAVYELDEDAIEAGRRKYRRNLQLYAEAMKSNAWPGYPDGIQPLSLPAWALKDGDL